MTGDDRMMGGDGLHGEIILAITRDDGTNELTAHAINVTANHVRQARG
jgi:hypothetical protein